MVWNAFCYVNLGGLEALDRKVTAYDHARLCVVSGVCDWYEEREREREREGREREYSHSQDIIWKTGNLHLIAIIKWN